VLDSLLEKFLIEPEAKTCKNSLSPRSMVIKPFFL
jgi:hypothetical protein